MDLLAAEITAAPARIPANIFVTWHAEFGTPFYTRIDARRRRSRRQALPSYRPKSVKESTLAGDPITAKLTRAPGNKAVHRRSESGDRQRLVFRPSIRHGKHLQDLRRKFPQTRNI